MPGASNLDHLQIFKPILFWKFSHFITFILMPISYYPRGPIGILPTPEIDETKEFQCLGHSNWTTWSSLSPFCSGNFPTFCLSYLGPFLIRLITPESCKPESRAQRIAARSKEVVQGSAGRGLRGGDGYTGAGRRPERGCEKMLRNLLVGDDCILNFGALAGEADKNFKTRSFPRDKCFE